MVAQFLTPFVMNIVRLSVWLVLLMVLFVPLERFFGLRRQRVFRDSFGTDVAYYFLSSLLPRLLMALPLTLLAGLLHRLVPLEFYEWVADQPDALRMLAAMVVGECGTYWGHRWSHEIPLLWRFHALHHGAEEIDWLVNTRAHPIDMVFTRLCGLIPMYVLGLAQPMADSFDLVPMVVTIVGTVWGFFIHSNLNWRLGWFEWLFSTPAFHHWHHTNDGPGVINKNYSSLLPWMDKLFGTFYLPKKWPDKYGIDGPLPESFAGQLLRPLFEAQPALAPAPAPAPSDGLTRVLADPGTQPQQAGQTN